jgi:hypothetical protein
MNDMRTSRATSRVTAAPRAGYDFAAFYLDAFAELERYFHSELQAPSCQ